MREREKDRDIVQQRGIYEYMTRDIKQEIASFPDQEIKIVCLGLERALG